MANRPDDFSPNVTSVVTKDANQSDISQLETGLASIGNQLAEASANTKALQATAATQSAYRDLDTKFRQKYADDPTNAEGLKELQEARQDVSSSLSENVPSMSTRAYQNKAIELGQASDASNALWAGKQQAQNAVKNISTSKNSFLMGAQANGIALASGQLDISGALNYMQAETSMRQFAEPVIGKDKTDYLLKSFRTDYAKTVVASVAETNPQMAAKILDDPAVTQHFTTQERGDMTDLIKRTQRQHDLNQQLQTVQQTSKLPDIVNDDKMSYVEKRARIDELDMQGAISSKAASSARRVIKSAEDLDSQTDTPVMADIIKRTYDLNENTSLKQQDYLKGVNELQDEILQSQDAGKLTGQDATKLNKQLSELTQKRVADATKAVGNRFGEVNKKFDVLPPQFRGDATRQLFYGSTGQNLTPQQLSNQADTIIDGINKQRRQQALGVVARTTNDDVFLQATGYTRDQVNETAKNRGIAPAQVIQALRDKYTAKNARPSKLLRAAPRNDDEAETPGIILNGPNPNDSDGEDDQ